MENPCFNGYCLFCPGQPEICGHHNAFKGTRKTPHSKNWMYSTHISKRPFMKTLMADIIQFAVFSAMRDSEITRITWSDLTISDKTIIVSDRKHSKEKDGNDQEVPLPGKAFDIVMKQPHTSERILLNQPYTVSTLFTRACKRLQIEVFAFTTCGMRGYPVRSNRAIP